jgi:hypothetical protein
VRVLEHVVRRAPLALRLLDLSTGAVVGGDVRAEIWPEADPAVRTSSTAPTAAGVVGFPHLKGLERYEDATTSRDDWYHSPLRFAPVPFVVRITDRSRTHLPVVRPVLVPAAAAVDVVLPPSPIAALPPGHIPVNVQLVTEAGVPAAWALVEVRTGPLTTGGVTDDRGVVVVPLPLAAPPTAVGAPATGATWNVTIGVRYRPADQVAAPGARVDDPPTLGSITTQAAALLSDGGAFAPTVVRLATGGTPLVVASYPPLAAPPAIGQQLVVRPVP